MTIETKFNIGDTVYIMYNDFVQVGIITRMRFIYDGQRRLLDYEVEVHEQNSVLLHEEDMHKTKEELYEWICRFVNERQPSDNREMTERWPRDKRVKNNKK